MQQAILLLGDLNARQRLSRKYEIIFLLEKLAMKLIYTLVREVKIGKSIVSDSMHFCTFFFCFLFYLFLGKRTKRFE